MMNRSRKVNMKWLNGDKINTKHNLALPTLQKPSEAASMLQKESIFQNFITGNREVDPPLQRGEATEHSTIEITSPKKSTCIVTDIKNLSA